MGNKFTTVASVLEGSKKCMLIQLGFVVFSLLATHTLPAQVNIIDPNAANTPDIEKCYSQTTLQTIFQFTANGGNAVATLTMLTGLEYVPGSLMLVSQTGGLTITETNPSLTSPVFTVTGPGGTILSGREIRFSYRVRSTCAATAGTAILPLNVVFNNQTSPGEITADVIEADLNLTSHAIQTASIGTPVTVPIIIQNGGLGATDNITFSITETGMNTTLVTVGGFPATLISQAGNVKNYQIPVAALSGGAFNNTEVFTMMRTVVLQSCTFSSSYSVNWGCNATFCQSPSPSGPGEFLLQQGAPNLTVTSTLITPSNLCTNTVLDVTYTNNGTGPSSAAAAFNNFFRFGMNSATGWTSGSWMTVGITLAGNPVTHVTGMSGTPASVNAAQFTSDPDGAGGLTDLDGDGSFDELPQGASVTFRVILKYTCPAACPAPGDMASMVAGASYTDQCGAAASSSGSTAFTFNNTAIGSAEVFYPANVAGGQTFNVQVCIARNFQGANCNSNVFALNLTLPTGVVATGVGSFNGTPAVVTTMGGVATISGNFVSGTTCFTIQLTYTCPASPLNFSYEALYTCSSGCSCVQRWGCGNFSILGGGCNPCTNGGLTTGNAVAQRITLGYTNRLGTTTVNPASIPASNLRKAMPCDEIRLTITNTMNGGSMGTAAFNNAFIEFSYGQLASANLLDYVSGTFNYFDASAGMTVNNIALPAPTSAVISGRHVLIFNFNAYIATLPGGTMAAGDVITAFPQFRVLNNSGLTVVPTQPVQPRVIAFNLATAGGNPAPGGDPRFTCDQYAPEFYLHNPQVAPVAVSGARSGCGSYQVSGWLNHELTVQTDEYPMEVRPLFRVNSVSVQIMNGDSYDPSVTPVLMISGSSDDPWYTGTFNLPAPSISGNTLTWTNPGTWPLHDLAGSNQSTTGYQLKFNLINSGCANATDGNLVTTWNYNRFGYGPPACQVATSSGATTGLVEAGAPVHVLTNLTGTINGTKQRECFDIRLENITSGRESRYIWLAMEDNLSSMDVVSVTDVTGAPVNLPLISYANGKWVRVTTSLPGGSFRLLRICVTYNNCTTNPMVIRQGWDCPAYPASPLTSTCPTQIVSSNLNIIPRIAAIQGNFIATTSLPTTICSDFGFDILVNSSQQGDVINPRTRVVLPNGMMLQGNVQIEYPVNSGNFQNAMPGISGQVINVNLNNHTLINAYGGLPGTVNANTVAYPAGQDRQARVRFNVRTTCDYFSGDRVSFQPFGEAACSGVAQGSGNVFQSARIKIQGAEPAYEGTFSINLGAGGLITGCNARTVAVSVQLADLAPGDGLPATTGSSDTIYLSFPSVIDYVPGSFVCTTVPVANCPVFLGQTIDLSGRRVLKFKLPANISIPNGGVTSIAFNFAIQPQQNIACTVSDQVTARILAVYSGIFCATTGMNCPQITALAGEDSTPVVLRKPEFLIETFNVACNAMEQFQYTAGIRLQNVALAAGETIVVEFHCLDALGQPTTLVETRTLTGPLAAGSLTTLTGSFGGCDPQNGVRISIPLTTSTAQFQCHCGPVSRVANNLNKCPGVSVSVLDNDVCDNETISATATLMGAATGGTWTRTGSGAGGTFSSTTSLTTVYTPSTADRTNGQVTLVFTTNDPTGTCTPATAMITVLVRTRPTVVASTLTVCATAFGSSNGSFTLTNADNLVDPADANVVTYHANQTNATNGTSPLSSPYTAANNAVIYARVVDPTTGCFRTTTLTLRVNALPSASNATLTVCEQDPPGSGLGVFNLTNANTTVNSGTGLTISYHSTLLEAQQGINALGAIITSNSTVVYARVVTNSTGCYNTSTVTLTVRPKPVAYSGQLQRCPDVFDGSLATFTLSDANIQVTGGVGGLTVTYHQSLTEAQQGINPLNNTYASPTDDVWVRVSNGFGCFAVDQVQLRVLENPEIQAAGTNVSCFGGANGTATVEVLGGALPYTYDWSNDGPENPDNDLPSITGLTTAVYTITVTDGNGCMAVDNIAVLQPQAALSAVINSVTNVACRGTSTGAIQMTVSGGTAPYSYNWPNPAADVEDPVNLPAGSYTVTVTDANGCTANSTATITQPATVLNATTTVNNNALCSGGNTGAATVTASGGTSPYAYLWSNGQTTPTATNLSAGAYTVTVTDAAGCTRVATAVITNPANLSVMITTSANVACFGGNTGSATAAGSGGTPPYALNWSNGASGTTASNLTAGTYTVTLTDASGCMAQTSVTITQPMLLVATVISQENVTCNGLANGSGRVFATGGTTPYTYTWPGGFTGSLRTGLAAGTYVVTVTDQRNCSTTVSVIITQPAALAATINTQTNVSCFGGNNGFIDLNVTGGPGPYNYNWSGSAPDIQDPVNLVAGTYSVTVTDAHGCTANATATITQPATRVTAIITAFTNASCNGGANGTATVTASGGTPNYTYLWSNGQTTATSVGMAAGSYQVTVTDMNGCTAVASITLINPALLDLHLTALSHVTCNGAADGSASVAASGGTPGYTYAWRTLANVPVGMGSTQINLAPGTYIVEVTDANACVEDLNVTINEPPLLVASIVNTTPASCNGGNDGTATATATGGTPGYSYAWPGGFTGPVRTGLTAGAYTVTVTDENGCQATAQAMITEPAAPVAITVDNIVPVACRGDATGAVFVTPSGGTPPYQYNWSGSAPDVQDPSGLTAGTYNLTVTDLHGCMAVLSAVVSEPATVVSVTISNIQDAACTGTGTGQATANPAGGTPGYTYLWSNGQTSATAHNLTAGAYQVTVTDANGCTAVATAVINNPANLTLSVIAETDVQCAGGSTGSALVQAMGGTQPYTYLWSDGTAGPILSGVAAGLYVVTVTDDNGCMAQASVSISEPAPLIASIQGTTRPTCFGLNNGTATAAATGGIGPYTFAWSGGAMTATATGLAPGTYTVTVTDVNGCTSTAVATVPAAPAALSLNIASQVNILCFGGANGAIDLQVTGGTGPYDYNWSGTAPDIQDPFGLTAGTYLVTVTDANGCTATTSATLTQPASALSAMITASSNPLCNGAINGTATVTASGGTPAYTYLWSNGQTTATAVNLAAGDYQVTVTDLNGCTTQAIVTLLNPPVLMAGIASKTDVLCNGGATGTATVTQTGGTAPYTYLWEDGQTTAAAVGLTQDFHFVTVTDANGCQSITSVEIGEPTLLVASIISTTPVLCNGDMNGAALATATGGITPYTFTWPGGFTGALRQGLPAGSHTLTVTDANGCTSTATAVVSGPAAPLTVAVNSITPVSCYGQSNGAINITAAGGTPPYSYDWNTLPDIEDPFSIAAGTYTIVVTDANGCTATGMATVNQPATPVTAVATMVNNAQCTGAGAGVATVTPSGGTPGYTYLWSNGQTTQTATGLVAGAYQVTVTDANGCWTVATVFITNPANLTALITSQTAVSCNGGSNGTATVTANGGTPPYLYMWSAGAQTTAMATGLPVGLHTVTVTDANGCQVTASVNISQPALLVLDVLATHPTSCAGASNGMASVIATGGTPGYIYTWPGGLAGPSQTGLAAGSYVVTVTDVNGCTDTETVVIGSDGTLLVTPLADIGVLCPGETVPAISLNATPIDPNTLYSWSGGAQAGLPNGNSTGLNTQIPGFVASATQGTYTVTVTAILQGCSAVETFDIVIQDVAPPAFTNCPNTIIMAGNDPDVCSAKVNWIAPTAIDKCGGNAAVIQTTGMPSGSVFPVGTHQIVYTADDGNGNTSTCSFTVVVMDTELPEINCPSPLIYEESSNGCDFLQTGPALNATATDNCQIVSLTHNYAAAPSNLTLDGAIFPEGATAVTWTAVDQAGNTISCTFTVIVADKTAPTVTAGTCPANIVVHSDDGVCGAVVNYTRPTFEDNCDGILLPGVLTGLAPGSVFPIGVSTVRYTYTDAAGNGPAVCEFTVTVNDTEFPQIICPSDVTVRTDGTVAGGPVTLIGTGPCGVTLSYNAPVGTDNCPDPETDLLSGFGAGAHYYQYGGIYTHEWSVTDMSGNTSTCQFTITVEDPVAPVISCPANTTVATDPGECTANVTYSLPLAGDNCPGYDIHLVQGPASGADFALGNTTVTYEVVDDMGNTAACSFIVTVIDLEEPEFLTCPPNRTINASTGAGNDCMGIVPDMRGEIVVSDNCTPLASLAASVVQSPAPGASFSNAHGDTQVVTFTITDNAGNTQTCTTILTLVDDVIPSISCMPFTRTRNANTNCAYMAVGAEFDAMLNDNCLATLSHDYAPAPNSHTLAGAIFPIGTTVVTFTATDANGNAITCSVTIQVLDNQPPVFVNCPANLIVNNGADQCGANVVFSTPIANDNCGATVSLVAPSLPSGSFFPVGTSTVVFRAVDAAGNSVDCSFTITVRDVQMPKAICTDFTVNLNAAGTATITAANINGSSTDNCTPAGNLLLVASQTTFDCSDLGANFVTLTVTDAAGNSNSCVATVTVHDVTAPSVTCPANITNLQCGNALPAPLLTAADFEAAGGVLSDNCTIDPNLVIQYSDFNNGLGTCASDGVRTIVRTYYVSDQSGNQTSCTQTLTYLEDLTPPVLVTPASNLPCIGGCINGVLPPQIQDWLAIHGGATAMDACSGVTWTNNFNATATQNLCAAGGTISVTFTARDACGNSVQTTASICIEVTERIGLAKRVVSNVLQPDGSSIVTYELNVQNFSNVPLSNIQITDNLGITFPNPCNVTVQSILSTDFAVNAGYNGSGDLYLLAGGVSGLASNDLNINEIGAVVLIIRVAACAGTGPFNNSAEAFGQTPGGTVISDLSTNGSNPDPDNDGNPADNSIPTPLIFVPEPGLGIAKRISEGPILTADQNYELTYEIRVVNFGNQNLSSIQVTDNLAATFGAASGWTVLGVESEEFFVNPAYNGSTVTNLLTGNDVLLAGAEGTIYIRVRVAPGGFPGPYLNSARAFGNSPDNITLQDDSQNGSEPDPDGDNDPTDNNEQTPLVLPCFIDIICPAVVDTIKADNDHGWCRALVNFPPAVAVTCSGAPATLIEFRLSGAGVTGVVNGVWHAGQPGGLMYNAGVTQVEIRASVPTLPALGYSSICLFHVQVFDKEVPEILCTDVTAPVGTNCEYVLLPSRVNAGTTDNCTPAAGLIYELSLDNVSYFSSLTFDVADIVNTPITVWLRVTDASGNFSTCTSRIHLIDNTAPSIVCPPDQIVYAEPNVCAGKVPDLIGALTIDNCGPIDTVFQVPSPGVLFGSHHGDQLDVVMTVVDEQGNTSSCTVTLTLQDTVAPAFLNCPQPNIVLNTLPGMCGSFVNFTLPLATDNCEMDEVVQTDNTGLTSGDMFPVGTTILEFTASDAAGNTSVCTLKVIINDKAAPEISCPANKVVDINPGLCGATVNQIAPIATDNCTGNLAVIYRLTSAGGAELQSGLQNASGTTFDVGTTTVTYRAQDQPLLLITEVTQHLQAVSGGANPVPAHILTGLPDGDFLEITNFGPASMDVSCLSIERLYTGGSETYMAPRGQILAPGQVLTLHFGNGTDFPALHHFNLPGAANLGAGQPAAYVISHSGVVLDVVVLGSYNPAGQGTLAAVPANQWSGLLQNIQAGAVRTTYWDTNSAQDFSAAEVCSGASIGSLNPGLPAFPANGTLTALQSQLPNTTFCSFTVTVRDNEFPQAGAYGPVGSTNSLTGGQIHAGDCFESLLSLTGPGQVADVNVYIEGQTDAMGNLTFTLISPQGIEIDLASGICGFNDGWRLTFDSDTTSNVTSFCHALGNGGIYAPVHSLEVLNGEAASGVWRLRIGHNGSLSPNLAALIRWRLDVQRRVPYLQNNVVLPNDPGACGARFTWRNPVLFDNCPAGIMQMQLTRADGSLLANQSVSINNWGRLRTYLFPVGETTVTYVLTDAAGNQVEYSFTVTVRDLERPVITCPANLTIPLQPGACEATPALNPLAASDNCGVNTITYLPAAPYPIGTTTVTMTVTDAAGNSQTCTFQVTVLEYFPADTQLACNGQINVTLGPDCTVEITPQMVLSGTDHRCYDNYVVTLHIAPGLPALDSSPFATLELAGMEIIVMVCDPLTGECCWGTVLVEQKEEPEFICPADTTISCLGDISPLITGAPVITSCIPGDSFVNFSDDLVEGEFCEDFPLIVTRTWTVSDEFGNTSTCGQIIHVEAFDLADIVFPPNYDNFQLPSFDCEDVAENPHLTHPDSTGYPVLTDGSDPFNGWNYCGASYLYTDEVFIICEGSYQILRTWKVLNPCQPVVPGINPLVHIQSIQVLDLEGPVINCPANMVISSGPFSCKGAVVLPPLQFTDGCSPASYTITAGSGSLTLINGVYVLSNLEEGIHYVTYRAKDDCGRKSQCTFTITVEDQIEPIPVCDDDLHISLGGQGFARVQAEEVDEGSSDNCGIAEIVVRRLINRDADCEEATPYYSEWGPFVDFNCCDAGRLATIEMRVTDYSGNSNICWLEVLIEDKLRPFCTAPHPASLDCDDLPYDFNAADTVQLQGLFGNASGVDNCSWVTTQELPPVENLHDCGFGTVLRRFQAVDAYGNVSINTCQQLITVNEVHNYEIKFPKDTEANCGTPNPDTLEFTTPGCDLLSVEVFDEFFAASGDECYKILRKYRVLNWCEYDGISPAVVVGRDEDCDGAPGDEAVWVLRRPGGPVYYDRDNSEVNTNPVAGTKGTSCDGITNPTGHWLNSMLDITTTRDPLTGNQNNASNPNLGPNDNIRNIASVGLWEYTQVIKVYDDHDPVIVAEEPEPFCSISNETCEGPVEIPFRIDEECTPHDMTIHILADTHADGVAIVDVTDQALSGTYPDYTINGTFPVGEHLYVVQVEDGCGNNTSTDIPFEVVDCKAPAPVCISGLSIELMQAPPDTDVDGDGDIDNGAMTIWAQDFIASAIDDCTEPIRYSIHKADDVVAGTDVPDPSQTGLILTCDDLGSVVIRIYGWDSAFNPYAVQPDGTVGGPNFDWCETYVLVQDNAFHLCDLGDGRIAGLITTEEDEPVARVAVNLSGAMNSNVTTPAAGTYAFNNLITGAQADYTVSPELDTLPLNGVSTFDLIFITRHILNIQLLDSPYKMIAADVNNDRKITTLDLIRLRRVILALDLSFTNNTSWRFIRADYVFPVPTNPWFEVFPEVYNVNDLGGPIDNADFIAVKIGDVNLSAATGFAALEARDPAPVFALEAEDRQLIQGNDYVVEFVAPASEKVMGYQGTLSFDPAAVELTGMDYGLAQEEHFGMRYVAQGLITTSWNGASADTAATGKMFSLRLRAKKDVLLSTILSIDSAPTLAEAYHQSGADRDLVLRFSGGVPALDKVVLEQNIPNPFAQETVIGFWLPEAYEEVSLTIRDVHGRVVKVFRSNLDAGRHEIRVQAKELPAGVFFYTLEAGSFRATRSLIVQE